MKQQYIEIECIMLISDGSDICDLFKDKAFENRGSMPVFEIRNTKLMNGDRYDIFSELT